MLVYIRITFPLIFQTLSKKFGFCSWESDDQAIKCEGIFKKLTMNKASTRIENETFFEYNHILRKMGTQVET